MSSNGSLCRRSIRPLIVLVVVSVFVVTAYTSQSRTPSAGGSGSPTAQPELTRFLRGPNEEPGFASPEKPTTFSSVDEAFEQGPPADKEKATGEAPAATLEVGESAFWEGPFIESAGTGQRATDDGLCRQRTTNTYVCVVGTYSMPAYGLWSGNRMGADVPACGAVAPCIDYQIDVGAGGARLRVAVDHPSGRDTMGLELYAPDGRFVTSSSPFAGAFNVEAYADDPAPGVWTARVVLFDVVGSGFRMRARLDPAPGTDSAVRALLPNLQMSPPFEVGFAECQLSETVQFGASRCLRFSLGPNNVGDGPLDLVINDTVGLSGTMYQRIHHSDGSVQERPAGEYAWHAAHGHYHHVATGGFDLLRVDDPSTGAMRQVGAGPKQGFCLAEQVIAEWDSFEQDEQWSATGSCTAVVDPPVGVRMGLTRGWGDVYPFYVEGNYVEFGDNADGLYVIRATSDPDDTMLETSESDNAAYAYVRVTGSVIEVFERGRGTSPWDPAKVIANDGRLPAL